MTLTLTGEWAVGGLVFVVILAYAAGRFLNDRRKRAIGKERLAYVVGFAEAAGFKLAEGKVDAENRSTSLTFEYMASDGASLFAWISQGLDTVHVRVGTLAASVWRRQERWSHENATASAFRNYIEDAEWTADCARATGAERLATIAAAAEMAGFSLAERSDDDGRVALTYTRKIRERIFAIAILSSNGEKADALIQACEVDGDPKKWPQVRLSSEAVTAGALAGYIERVLDGSADHG